MLELGNVIKIAQLIVAFHVFYSVHLIKSDKIEILDKMNIVNLTSFYGKHSCCRLYCCWQCFVVCSWCYFFFWLKSELEVWSIWESCGLSVYWLFCFFSLKAEKRTWHFFFFYFYHFLDILIIIGVSVWCNLKTLEIP